MSPCDEAPGYRDKDGYVDQMRDGVRKGVHRWAWEDAHGPIPESKVLRHKCDNPPCRNAEHLELGTQAENIADRDRRGRTARNERSGQCRFTDAQVAEMRASPLSQNAIARQYGISQSHVSRIRNGQSRT